MDMESETRYRGLGCASILAATLLVLFVIGVVVATLVRMRSSASFWPSPAEVGLTRTAAIVNGALLIGSGVVVWLACRASAAGKRRLARGALMLAVACGVIVLGIWLRECRSVIRLGISPWNVRGTVFPQADLTYVQAVKARLKTLYHDREDLRTQHPDRFDEMAKREFDVVTSLQNNLVSWTEQEVGHWLDDTDQRWGAMRLFAFQVLPNAADAAAFQELCANERSIRDQRRQWLNVLRAYCQSRLSKIAPSNAKTGGAGVSGSPGGRQPDPATGGTSPLPGESDEMAVQDAQQKLQRLGGADWAFSKAVLEDPADAVLIGERLNQIQTALNNLGAREVFLKDGNEPLATGGSVVGLNRRFPFLRLPVHLPPGRAWAAGFILLSGGYGLMLLCAATMLTRVAFRSVSRWTKLRSEPAVWCWWPAIACGLVALLLLYAV